MVSFWKVSKTWGFFFSFLMMVCIKYRNIINSFFFCYYKLHLGNLHMSQHKKWLHLRWFMSIDLKPFRTLGVWIRTTLCTHWNIWQIPLQFPDYLSNPFPFPKFFFKSLHFPYIISWFFLSRSSLLMKSS